MVTSAQRLTLDMSINDIIRAMDEGNPGAMNVCAQMIADGPDGFLTITRMDSAHIYGSGIWLLYKDVCSGNMEKMKLILLAEQWGIISNDTLRHAMDNRGQGIDWDAVTKAVEKGMPI